MSLLIASCSRERLASSEIGNPPSGGTVKGIVATDTGRPSVGASVMLLPVDFDPVHDKGRIGAPVYHDTTDAHGAFQLKGVNWNRYNLLIADPATGQRLIVRDQSVRFDTLSISDTLILHPPGTIAIRLPDTLAIKGGYIYLPGTEYYIKLDTHQNASGMQFFDSVASGESPPIFYGNGDSTLGSGNQSRPVKVAEGLKVIPGDTVPAGVFEKWAFNKKIFLNTTASGAAISGSVLDFPLLVRLQGSDLDFSTVAPDGHDIRFTDKTGNPLAFEIETWNPYLSQGTVWVRLDSIRGNDSAQFFRMYWGNPAASMSMPSKAVFDTSLGYASVWHLGAFEQGTTQFRDASGQGNTMIAGGGLDASHLEASSMGGGIHLDGAGRTLTTIKIFNNPTLFTISLWFKTTSDSGGKLMGFGVDPAMKDTARDRHLWIDTAGKVHFGVHNLLGDKTKKMFILSGSKTYNDGAWHFVAGTLSPAGLALYIDGDKVDEDASVKVAQMYKGYWKVGFDFAFYDWPFPPKALYFKGSIDEVRVADKAYSAEWIKLTWESQRTGGQLLKFR